MSPRRHPPALSPEMATRLRELLVFALDACHEPAAALAWLQGFLARAVQP